MEINFQTIEWIAPPNGDCGQAGSGGESPQTVHPTLWNGKEGALNALKGGKRLHAAGDYGQADSAWRRGAGDKLSPAKQTNWTRN